MMDRDVSDSGGPNIISWNVTSRCPLACTHCYIDADGCGSPDELDTAEGFALIDQIAAVNRPILILSGGEPLLRPDIFDLARHATRCGLAVAMGTSGVLITDAAAGRIRDAGIRKVAVSIDSTDPRIHDAFRGVSGAWRRAVDGIHALRRADIPVQIHTVINESGVDEIDKIMAFGKGFGIRDYQFFFLVPTGRGERLATAPPEVHEAAIERILAYAQPGFSVRPTCAPQFVRVVARLGLDPSWWGRGCIAGTGYCRITPVGDVTPCPYLPVSVGNVRQEPFGDIWYGSDILIALRDPDRLSGRCGRCGYRRACGGCRARAYGEVGDILAEDPCCPYEPEEVEHG